MGSNVQDLIGDDIMIRRTSAIEHPRKDDSEVDAESNAGGAGLPAVDVMTSSTSRRRFGRFCSCNGKTSTVCHQ